MPAVQRESRNRRKLELKNELNFELGNDFDDKLADINGM